MRLRERRLPPKEEEHIYVEKNGRLIAVHKQVILWRKRRKRAADKLDKLKAELEELKADPMAKVLKRKFFMED